MFFPSSVLGLAPRAAGPPATMASSWWRAASMLSSYVRAPRAFLLCNMAQVLTQVAQVWRLEHLLFDFTRFFGHDALARFLHASSMLSPRPPGCKMAQVLTQVRRKFGASALFSPMLLQCPVQRKMVQVLTQVPDASSAQVRRKFGASSLPVPTGRCTTRTWRTMRRR